MTGIRSWTAEVTAFGVVVRIEQFLIQLPLGSFHRSHSPANANNSPSLTSKQNGCFAVPVQFDIHRYLDSQGRLDFLGGSELRRRMTY